jgi:large subunit ribosomal protein L10
MSKPVKALIRKELVRRLTGVDSLAVLSLAGVDGVENNRLRREFRGKDIRITVVKNSIARQAFDEVGLTDAQGLIEGPCALVYGGDPAGAGIVGILRELLGRRRDVPALRVTGALMEGRVFGPDRVEELSRYPTRQEALARLAALILSPGGRLVAAMRGPGGRLAGALKAIQDRGEPEGEHTGCGLGPPDLSGPGLNEAAVASPIRPVE